MIELKMADGDVLQVGCGGCVYFESHKIQANADHPKGERGRCKRFPPSASGYVGVFAEDWCGEFVKKAEPVPVAPAPEEPVTLQPDDICACKDAALPENHTVKFHQDAFASAQDEFTDPHGEHEPEAPAENPEVKPE